MAKDYKNLGGALANADTIPAELVEFKSNDVTPLTLLNEEDSMTPIAQKVDDAKVALEEAIRILRTQGDVMQQAADYVNNNSEGNLTW